MTSPPSGTELIRGFEETLKKCGFDYEQAVNELGQVKWAEERQRGKKFDLHDHVRGLLLAQLSSNRPWKPIADHLTQIERIFFDYDPDQLEKADPAALVTEIIEIRCGNRVIRQQLRSLASNIATLRRIEREFGTLDAFLTSETPFEIARNLSKPGSAYKLMQLGAALAFEYFKNVGIPCVKPDVHLCRILGRERLGYSGNLTDAEAAARLACTLAKDAQCNPIYLDNLLWIFCADGYGAVCRKQRPKCTICELRNACRYPKKSVEGSDSNKTAG